MSDYTDVLSAQTCAVEQVACPLCGTGESRPFLEKSGWRIVRCSTCGLCYLNPRPAASELERFYLSDYDYADESKGLTVERALLELTANVQANDKVHYLLATAERLVRGRQLLDVGSGLGRLLWIAEQRGWDAVGIEPSPLGYEVSRRLVGDRVLKTDLVDGVSRLAAGSFDLITMLHFLEHYPDPKHALEAARNLLVPGGLLIITVPNIESAAFRRLGEQWEWLALPIHLMHFSRQSLGRLLEQAGFRVLALRAQVGGVGGLGRAFRQRRAGTRSVSARGSPVGAFYSGVRFGYHTSARWLNLLLLRFPAMASALGANGELLAIAQRT